MKGILIECHLGHLDWYPMTCIGSGVQPISKQETYGTLAVSAHAPVFWEELYQMAYSLRYYCYDRTKCGMCLYSPFVLTTLHLSLERSYNVDLMCHALLEYR